MDLPAAGYTESPKLTLSRPRSEALFDAAQALIPGGVNSPVRAWKAVGGTPVHVAHGSGARCTDVDGHTYIDLVMSYGPLMLGHAPPSVTEALQAATARGTTFGAPTAGELALAQRIVDYVPCVERIRLVNSGTEATMSALRLARAHTGRDKLVKFEGCYHGHGDSFLVKAGSGMLTLGAPDSPGVPAQLAAQTLVAGYNDLASVERLFEQQGAEISSVFVEPVAGNMGTVLPVPGFLEGLRRLCDEHGALLVYDEVMTGFRVARGGYMELCGVLPDLVTLGKVIGGGLPIGAYGGRADLMNQVAPAGKMYQAGTLSGNPLAVAAGEAMLTELGHDSVYERLEASGARLEAGLLAAAEKHGVPLVVGRQGSMLCPYLTDATVTSFGDVMASDRERWVRFFHGMLERGVLLPPSPFEAWFLSTAHDAAIIDEVVAAADGAFGAL
jgi:glutamate-1-semialdehyde 2,1-aminomutase